jgi:hypothetical protein
MRRQYKFTRHVHLIFTGQVCDDTWFWEEMTENFLPQNAFCAQWSTLKDGPIYAQP